MMSTMRRQQRAIEGNTARKVQTLEYPSRERQPERRERRHAEKSNVQYVNVLYMIFLAAASCMVLWSCVNYLQLQAETTSRVKHIASLETELEDLRKENNDNYTRIMTSVDLDHIRDVAINELGMVYAEPNQVILYDGGTDDYVRQNGSIPPDYSSMKDKLLGKDGE
ncbi:FtsB/FtsL family cell division protein [Hominiventricola filiformis]|uniref:Cell division protein FtsL n=1 Tax=Hominiventricola filiformis TaxID=2885352 RepID=A0AAE3DBK3_9FIRM|nr:cell division protein FtsL [Hominiventricola filiformis]MCC2125434.1 cell division protein FtsL [Hominiventricola filiformis]